MCVLAFARNAHSRWRLVLVGNRDELHARPCAALARWRDAPGVIAGRDLEAGGTWMGVREPARAAVVTNVRGPQFGRDGWSRGLLVAGFLSGPDDAAGCAARLAEDAPRYRPFNLLLFDGSGARFVSNVPAARVTEVSVGVHGLSNGDMDAPWPKVTRATGALHAWLAADTEEFATLLDAFASDTVAPDDALPDTGVGIDMERALSPVFVRGARYGTRATTLIALGRDGDGCIIERRFGPGGVPRGETTLRFGCANE
ncbi:MAG TPA: NRDE family protein [Rhodanobacteraceae bacterium]|nr:NRDE family protein [Rhodanobacteraceae bacterium]